MGFRSRVKHFCLAADGTSAMVVDGLGRRAVGG
jgi:hypothetical protein